MTGARGDGRAFTLRGSGVVQLLTPDTFHPGQAYQVKASGAGGKVTTRQVRADRDGRLPIRVDLGHSAPLDQLTNDIQPSGTDLSTARPITVQISG